MSLCVCPICGAEKKSLTKHLSMAHRITKQEFLEKYPNTKMIAEETSNKISISLKRNWEDPDYAERCSRYWRSEEHGKEVSERLKKEWETNPDKYRIPFAEYARSEEGRRVRSNNMKNVSQSLWEDPDYVEARREQGRSQMIKNLQNPSYGYNRESCLYDGVYYRSSWEVNFAKFLDSRRIKYTYESSRFEYTYNNIVHYYIPDFYLEDYNIFIEIKPSCKINELTDIKLSSVKSGGYKIYYITDCTEEGLNSQLVPLLSDE